MEGLEYELVGEDLPKIYKGRQEPLLHYGGSWELARGNGWIANITSRGDLNVLVKGERVRGDELADYYSTDNALHKAEDSGELEINYNNWYEVEFLLEKNNGYEYLDIMGDDTVCFSFDEAIQVFKDYMADESFTDELKNILKEKEENNNESKRF